MHLSSLGSLNTFKTSVIRFIWKTQRFLHTKKENRMHGAKIINLKKSTIQFHFIYTHSYVAHISFVGYLYGWRSGLGDGFISYIFNIILWLEHFPLNDKPFLKYSDVDFVKWNKTIAKENNAILDSSP